jgi:hypothetical protein
MRNPAVPFAALAALLLLSAACDPGPSSAAPSNPDPGARPDVVDPHAASLHAIADLVDRDEALPSADALVASIAALPDVKRARAARGGESVLLTFDDGTPATILVRPRAGGSARPSAAPPTSKAPPPRPIAVPKARTAVVMNALGNLFHDPTPDLSAVFGAAGYRVKTGTATIDELKDPSTFSDAAVFYVSSHGDGVEESDAPGAPETYGLWTGTCKTDRIPGAYAIDLAATPRRLSYFLARNTDGKREGDCISGKRGSEWHYVATAAFFERYVSLPTKGSFAFLDTCHSDGPLAQPFKQALFAKGAAAYAGWSTSTHDTSWPVAPYLFDRMAGANTFDPPAFPAYAAERPRQRPFAWPLVVSDMQARGLDVSPVTGARLGVSANPAFAGDEVSYGYLAPPLTTVAIFEDRQEMVVALMAGDTSPGAPSDVEVKLGGATLPIKRIEPGKALWLDLSQGGPTAGDLVMTVNGHPSNAVRVSEWRGLMRVVSTTSGSSITDEFEVNLHFRSISQSMRVFPHEPPRPAGIGIDALPDTTVTFRTSGSWGSCTRTESEQGPLPLAAWGGWVRGGMGPKESVGHLRFRFSRQGVARHDCDGSSTLQDANAGTGSGEVSVPFRFDPETLELSAPISGFTDGARAMSVQLQRLEPVLGAAPNNAR